MVTRDAPLAPLTTLGIGGPAAFLVAAASLDDVQGAVREARRTGLPLLVLGSGSNLLVADEGVRAIVLRVTASGFRRSADGRVRAQAGAPWDAIVADAVASGYAGIECLSGIPGTVGAAVVQNIGAYGQQVADVLVSVEAVDTDDASVSVVPAAACRLGYRRSIFNSTHADRYVVWSVALRLRSDAVASRAYADLASLPAGASLTQVRGAVLDIRERKGMLAMPGRRGHRSAGSFFKNPVVRPVSVPPGAVAWPQPDGTVKVAAAWLIEHAGVRRGDRSGGAAVSPDHTLSIINAGGGTARDVVALARTIRRRVHDRFGILLEPEVRFWGFPRDPMAD